MAFFKCKMCGGSLEFAAGTTVIECEYCGTRQTLPRLDDEKRANMYDRANHFRRNNDFDKAMGIYENILAEDNTDAEAYWSLVLCRYGIEYVEDPTSRKRVPTVNRAQFTSVFDDVNYKSALQYADPHQRTVYEEEAKTINEIQKGILAISREEEPFDVFICYKETDSNGRRTPDSVLAQELYYQLKQEGFKVFFSRITLEDKLGSAYEPYIFAALNSAKVMVVIGTRPEYLNAVWVKNEWSRYLALIKQGQKKMLIPAYKDMDPYDLPDEFSHLQAQDMSKLGFMQDLTRGIKKIAKADEPKVTVIKETAAPAAANSTAPLLRRAFMFLEDRDWESADEYCEKVLDREPECAEAYLGKLMASLRVQKKEQLRDHPKPFDNNPHYQKVLRFADEKLRSTLTEYIEHIKFRNFEGRYVEATNGMTRAQNEKDLRQSEIEYKSAAELFSALSDYKDSKALEKQCLEKAEAARNEALYSLALSKMQKATGEAQYRDAAESFKGIRKYKDSESLIRQCLENAETAKNERLYNQAMDKMLLATTEAQYRDAAEAFRRIRHYNDAEVHLAKCIELAEATVKDQVLAAAISKMQTQNMALCKQALELFSQIPNWRDSNELRVACQQKIDAMREQAEREWRLKEKRAKRARKITLFSILAIAAVLVFVILLNTVIIPAAKYNGAIDLMEAGNYTDAISAFEALDGYRDSESKIEDCETAILDGKYDQAMQLMKDGDYYGAIDAFRALDGHRDSIQQISLCNTAILEGKYHNAVSLLKAGKADEAYNIFWEIGNYKDSIDKAEDIRLDQARAQLKNAKVGDCVSFGVYEQDNNTANGKERVKWLVLEVKDGRALLISKDALDCKPYNTKGTGKWETCTLRSWLNNDFINVAFSNDEKAMIPTVAVPSDKNPSYGTSSGNATKDKIFLLSITDAEKYFSSDSARQCKATDYAVANGTWIALGDYCCWWLRSPGYSSSDAARVLNDGDIFSYGYKVNIADHAVRPTFWIDLP